MVWEIQQRNRELEEEVHALKERMAAMQMQGGAPVGNTSGGVLGMTMGLGQDMAADMAGMQWPISLNYNEAHGLGGFGGPPMMREGTPASGTASYPPSDGLLSPFPGPGSPVAPSFSDLEGSGLDFARHMPGPADDLGLGSDLASRQYFPHHHHAAGYYGPAAAAADETLTVPDRAGVGYAVPLRHQGPGPVLAGQLVHPAEQFAVYI